MEEVSLHRSSVIYRPSQGWDRVCSLPHTHTPVVEFLKLVLRRLASQTLCPPTTTHAEGLQNSPKQHGVTSIALKITSVSLPGTDRITHSILFLEDVLVSFQSVFLQPPCDYLTPRNLEMADASYRQDMNMNV